MAEDDHVSPEEVAAEMAEALEAAGIHPAYVYAFRKCGFMVIEMNREVMTDDQLEEWEDALDEWLDANPDQPL